MPQKKTILVAPLHWGIGHATRCIPLIRALLAQNFTVMLASDGAALLLLQKEFPALPYLELPSYHIQYSKKGSLLKLKLLVQLPRIWQAIRAERRVVANLVDSGKIHGIISDNRFGAHHASVPSVYITHQLKVLSGNTTWFSTKLHQGIIKKFDECWVPDSADMELNLSGALGHLRKQEFPVKYIGALSGLKKQECTKEVDILLLLSGPEPQRTILENLLKSEFANCKKKVLMVRGVLEETQKWEQFRHMEIVNFLTGVALAETLNRSQLVVARSGYSTIMDLALLEKKVFFIPTPGQFEQEYLAKRLKDLRIAPACRQEKFKLKKLEEISDFKGFQSFSASNCDYSDLFSLFQGK